MAEQSDETLLNRYFSGDARAFQEFYRRHAGRVVGFAKRKGFSQELAEEIKQESFLRLHRSIHHYERGRPALAWFFTIVANCITDAHRQRARASRLAQETGEEATHTQDDSIDFDVTAAMTTLSSEQRRVVELKILSEHSFKEIAHSMKKSEVSLRKTFERAKAKMKTMLLGDE